MSKDIRLKKGVDINLKGSAAKVLKDALVVDTYVVKPTDFNGVVPKLLVKPGHEVKAGTPLFYDKKNDKVKFCSPVSGEVVEINRGAKRKILEIKVLADKENSFVDFGSQAVDSLSKEQVTEKLLDAGLWPFIKQRPYGVIAKPQDTPKSIFISGFDTAPLAPDTNFALQGQEKYFQIGVDAVAKLTDGKVHLNLTTKPQSPNILTETKNVEINYVTGPHPAGNVGVQIHHIDPINKGDMIWYLYPQDVVAIGKLFAEGKLDLTRVIALTGSSVKETAYYKVRLGTNLAPLLENNLEEGNQRVISGNVLTGTTTTESPYLGFYDTQVTVIPEGTDPQFMGWLTPNLDSFSISRALFSWLQPNKEYDLNTNMRGEERAFVVTGQYEQVLPMDILPVQLLKAILAEDIEKLEQLGIYEVTEEDFALCEVVCTSKFPVQQTLRKGLDLCRAELE